MSDEIIPVTNEEKEADLVDQRALNHIRVIRSLGDQLEGLCDNVERLTRKMVNDGSLTGEVLKGDKFEKVTMQEATEYKDVLSLLQAVTVLVNGDVEMIDHTSGAPDKKRGKKNGRDVLSVFSIT